MKQPFDPRSLVANALALKQAAQTHQPRPSLRGKYVGLVCEDPNNPDAQQFARAANELGVQVARIRPSVAGMAQRQDLEQSAQWLGRLYDAIAAHDVPGEVVEQIREIAHVPVLDTSAGGTPLSAALETMPDDDKGMAANRLYVLQAMLIEALRN